MLPSSFERGGNQERLIFEVQGRVVSNYPLGLGARHRPTFPRCDQEWWGPPRTTPPSPPATFQVPAPHSAGVPRTNRGTCHTTSPTYRPQDPQAPFTANSVWKPEADAPVGRKGRAQGAARRSSPSQRVFLRAPTCVLGPQSVCAPIGWRLRNRFETWRLKLLLGQGGGRPGKGGLVW